MIDHGYQFRLKPRWIHAPRSDSYPIGQRSRLTRWLCRSILKLEPRASPAKWSSSIAISFVHLISLVHQVLHE